MPIASHSGWLARTRATVSATSRAELTATEPTRPPVAGLRTSICSGALVTSRLDPSVVPVLWTTVPLSTGYPSPRPFGWSANCSRKVPATLGDAIVGDCDERAGDIWVELRTCTRAQLSHRIGERHRLA